MSAPSSSERTGQCRRTVATWLSLILQPMTAAAILYAVAGWSFGTGWEAAQFFLVGLIFVAAGPAVLIICLVRFRKVSDLDLTDRRERLKPYLMIVGLNSFALLFFWYSGAPAPLMAISISYMTVTLVGGIISQYWKISMHLAGISGPVTALTMLIHPLMSLLYLICLPVAWARLTLNKHTLSQVVWGSLFSAGLTMMVIVLVGLSS